MRASNNFKKEREQIRERIWSFIQVKDDVVLDVGVGNEANSTKKLIDLGAKVVAIDIDWRNLSKHKGINAKLIQCDASQLPFRNSVFDLAVVDVTMHEINPDLHLNVFFELARVSKKVMLVEINPSQDPICTRFQNLMTQTIHDLSEFEEYQEFVYWKSLFEKCGFKLLTQERITYQNQMPASEVDDFINNSITAMKEYGVSRKYINKMKALAKDIKQNGMRLAGITVLIGERRYCQK